MSRFIINLLISEKVLDFFCLQYRYDFDSKAAEMNKRP